MNKSSYSLLKCYLALFLIFTTLFLLPKDILALHDPPPKAEARCSINTNPRTPYLTIDWADYHAPNGSGFNPATMFYGVRRANPGSTTYNIIIRDLSLSFYDDTGATIIDQPYSYVVDVVSRSQGNPILESTPIFQGTPRKCTFDFALNPLPHTNSNENPLVISQGSSGATNATVRNISGVSGTVNFSLSGLPSGATSSIRSTTGVADSCTLAGGYDGSCSVIISINVPNTVAPGIYSVQVRAQSGSVLKTANFQLTIQGTPPPAPTNLRFTSPQSCNGTNARLNFAWDNSGGTTASFNIFRRVGGSGVFQNIKNVAAPTTSTFDEAPSISFVEYYVGALSQNGISSQSFSNIISTTTIDCRPPTPFDYSLTTNTNTINVYQDNNVLAPLQITASALQGNPEQITLTYELPSGTYASWSGNNYQCIPTCNLTLNLGAYPSSSVGTQTTARINGESPSRTTPFNIFVNSPPSPTPINQATVCDGDNRGAFQTDGYINRDFNAHGRFENSGITFILYRNGAQVDYKSARLDPSNLYYPISPLKDTTYPGPGTYRYSIRIMTSGNALSSESNIDVTLPSCAPTVPQPFALHYLEDLGCQNGSPVVNYVYDPSASAASYDILRKVEGHQDWTPLINRTSSGRFPDTLQPSWNGSRVFYAVEAIGPTAIKTRSTPSEEYRINSSTEYRIPNCNGPSAPDFVSLEAHHCEGNRPVNRYRFNSSANATRYEVWRLIEGLDDTFVRINEFDRGDLRDDLLPENASKRNVRYNIKAYNGSIGPVNSIPEVRETTALNCASIGGFDLGNPTYGCFSVDRPYVSLSWESASNANYYRVWRRTNGIWTEIPGNIPTTSWVDSNAQPRAQYEYSIYAYNDGPNPIPSRSAKVANVPSCAAFNFAFSPPPANTGNIQRGNSYTAPFTLVKTSDSDQSQPITMSASGYPPSGRAPTFSNNNTCFGVPCNMSVTIYTDNSTPINNYNITITGTSNNGFGSTITQSATFTTNIIVPPPGPFTLNQPQPDCDGHNARRIGLSWTTSSDASSYQVFRKLSSEGSWSSVPIATVPAPNISYVDRSLSPNIRYDYLVRAINDTPPTRDSNVASATAPWCDATPPDLVSIKNINAECYTPESWTNNQPIKMDVREDLSGFDQSKVTYEVVQIRPSTGTPQAISASRLQSFNPNPPPFQEEWGSRIGLTLGNRYRITPRAYNNGDGVGGPSTFGQQFTTGGFKEFNYLATCQGFFQTEGDIHTNTQVDTPGGGQ